MQNEAINLVGQRFGRLTVIEKGAGRKTSGGQYKTNWLCLCECGEKKLIDGQKLRKGKTLSCGCLRNEKIKNLNFKDITGKKFGRLEAIRFLKPEERTVHTNDWLCRCECGKTVQTSADKLNSGHTKSCGCLNVMTARNMNLKYKHSNKRLYSVYKSLMSRCYDTRNREYQNYGGRNIKVCEEWKNNYDAFAEWALQSGYDVKAGRGECTIDRTDVNGDYEPSNCRWVTNQVQQNNRRDCIYAKYDGETHTAMEWSKILNLSYSKVHYHLKLGRSINYILDTV